MKKLYSLLALVTITTFSFGQTPTQQVSETFSFTGALNANGWVTHSGTAGQLTSNGSSAQLTAGNSEDVNKALTTPYTFTAGMINKADYTTTINVPSGTGLTTTGDYFMGLGGTAGATMTTFYGRLYIKGSATGYTLGVLNNSGGTVTPTYALEIPYGTPATVKVTYVYDQSVVPATQVATLEITGQAAVSNSTGTTFPSGTANGVSSIALRTSGSSTSGTGTISVGPITVATYSAYLGVSDINSTKSNFVKNTLVHDEINFGARADVKVYNMNSQLVKSASVSENKNMDVSDLAHGMYIVTGTVNGEPVSQKILKK